MTPTEEKYQKPITIVFSNVVARVYYPVLDATERAKRMKKIHKATENILRKG